MASKKGKVKGKGKKKGAAMKKGMMPGGKHMMPGMPKKGMM